MVEKVEEEGEGEGEGERERGEDKIEKLGDGYEERCRILC